MRENVRVNRKYKATVFELLYRDKSKLLELYNGLNGTEYADPEELEICTLENAVYMGMKNDVSFILASEMNLYEHQSTINPNMPLRDLFYIAKQLEKYVKRESIYSSSLVRIPVPRFVVFYNGTDQQPERTVLRLSEAFEKSMADPDLELKVTMLNINLGSNRELMEKCRTLHDYAVLVDLVRSYAKEMPIEEAADRAVEECIHRGVLREFLMDQRMEVVAVSILEWDEIEQEKYRRSEMKAAQKRALEEGLEQGRALGLEEGLEQGLQQGEIRFAELTAKLLAASRLDDLKKAISDPEARKALYQEFGLTPDFGN